MKTFILIFLLLLPATTFAQKSQVAFHAGTGLFSYGGESATRSSFINLGDVPSVSSYTNNPYGKSSAFSYAFGVQLQRFTSKDFIYGIQLSYESLASKLTLDYAYGDIAWSIREGETTLRTNFINVFPSIGQRVKLIKGIDSDFLLGADFALALSAEEKYNLTTDQGDKLSGQNARHTPSFDFRPRIEFVTYYQNIGLSIGYSHGLTNYQSNLDGANRQVNARYLRFALSFRLM